MALVRAWPRCREPVTFGGGMHIMKMPRGFGADTLERYGEETAHATGVMSTLLASSPSRLGAQCPLTPYSGLKKPCCSHQGYQAASTY